MGILLAIHIVITLALIGVVLLQKSDGGGLGFGSSGSGMFSARGAANLLTRATAILAVIFFANCLIMSVVTKNQIKNTTSFLKTPESK